MDSDTKKIFRENFAEINPPLRPEEAVVEAHRCLYCFDAPCVQACPTHIDIPRFIKQIGSGNLQGSAKTILEANALGHSCARACPVEVLCEGSCVYHEWQEKPIDIARLQRRATDFLNEKGVQPFAPGEDNELRVAVIGGGPAGLSCASYLRRLGFAVTLFEKHKDTAGGLNTFGIAEYKMDQKVSLDEIRRLLKLGITVKMGVEVGKDLSIEQLLKGFDAVFVGIGLGETHKLGIPGEELRGVWDALSFIRFVKDRDLGPIGKSDCTVVIGAGNTSIDSVTQSKRTGAKKVVMAYRRSEAEMGAYGFEYELAKLDGAEFLWNAAPLRIVGKSKVEAIEFARTKTVSGKLVGTKETVRIPCDRVIKAIGQTKHFALAKSFGLDLASDGRIKVEPETLRTSHPMVFAGGDSINGGKEVVNAAADGKRAAFAIHKALRPGVPPPPGNDYWISTIDGRKVAPIMPKPVSERKKHA